MLRVLAPLILLVAFVIYVVLADGDVESIDDYPLWIIDSAGNYIEQTSGIYYLGKLGDESIFLTCDDIGKINKLTINESITPPSIKIVEVGFSNEVQEVFTSFRKQDFEDISFDKKENKVYLSVEGYAFDKKNPMEFKKHEGIYELTCNNDALHFDSLIAITKLDLPENIFEYTQDNVGIEGLTLTDNYFFFGLENCRSNEGNFTDSTYLYILNRKTNDLIIIPTRELLISSICGLYARSDYELFGIDRNARSMFSILFKPDFTIEDVDLLQIDLSIPNHPDINQILGVAPESITIDDRDNIYVIIDPWKDYYKPDSQDNKKLSEKEKEYFKKAVPIIYKFEDPF